MPEELYYDHKLVRKHQHTQRISQKGPENPRGYRCTSGVEKLGVLHRIRTCDISFDTNE